MTFPRYRRLLGYWQRQPPTHVLLKGLIQGFGCEVKDDVKEIAEESNNLDDLMSDFSAAGGR